MRVQHAVVGAWLGLGVGALAAPCAAQAFECDVVGPRAPAPGDVDVPTDTLIWGYSARQRLELGGEVVAADARWLSVGLSEWPVLVPREPLLPDTEYAIVVQYGQNDSPGTTYTFRTGAGPVAALPEPPLFLTSTRGMGPFLDDKGNVARWQALDFEPVAGFRFLFGDAMPLDASTARRLPDTLTSIEDLFTDQEVFYEDRASDAFPEWGTLSSSMTVGITSCGYWPDAGDRQDLRFASVDIAGHASTWANIGTIELPSYEEAVIVAEERREAAAKHNIQGPRACAMGASVGGRGASGAAWLVLGAGLARVARRRSARRERR